MLRLDSVDTRDSDSSAAAPCDGQIQGNGQYVAWLRKLAWDQPEAILGVLEYWTRPEATTRDRELVSN